MGHTPRSRRRRGNGRRAAGAGHSGHLLAQGWADGGRRRRLARRHRQADQARYCAPARLHRISARSAAGGRRGRHQEQARKWRARDARRRSVRAIHALLRPLPVPPCPWCTRSAHVPPCAAHAAAGQQAQAQARGAQRTVRAHARDSAHPGGRRGALFRHDSRRSPSSSRGRSPLPHRTTPSSWRPVPAPPWQATKASWHA